MKTARSLRGDLFQHLAEWRVKAGLARPRFTRVEIPLPEGSEPLAKARMGGEVGERLGLHFAVMLVDGNPVADQRLHRGEHGPQIESSMVGEHLAQPSDLAGNCHRQSAVHAGPVGGRCGWGRCRGAGGVLIGPGGGGGPLSIVVDRKGLVAGVPVEQEASSAEARTRGAHNSQREGGPDRGIDHVPALFQQGQAHLAGGGMIGGDHRPLIDLLGHGRFAAGTASTKAEPGQCGRHGNPQ